MSTLAFLLSLLLFFIPPAQLLIEKIWESESQNNIFRIFNSDSKINFLIGATISRQARASKDSEHNDETDEEE